MGTPLPAGSRVHHVTERNKNGKTSGSDDTPEWVCEISLPWAEDEFFNQPINRPHPSEDEANLPDRAKLAIFNILTNSVEDWKAEKKGKLEYARKRAIDLEKRETEANNMTSPVIRRVNHEKQTILTSELFRGINYGDLDVCHRLLTGFPPVGTMKEVSVFQQRPTEEIRVGADPVWLVEPRKHLVRS